MHKDVCVSARMPEIIRSQASNPKRRKKNKEIHNAGERNRKEKINSGINRIGELLPCSQALKQSKNMILGEAFRYITELKRQNDEMLLNGGDKVQAEEIKRLRHQLEDLQKESAHYIELLKANDINFLDDPTIHWKGKQRSAKVAKVSPTHLTSMGTIVYSNGNSACPTREVPVTLRSVVHIDQCPANAEMLQPSLEIQKSMGQTAGTTNDPQVVVSSSSSQIPVATLIPAVSKSCFTIVEQYSPLTPTTPKLHPPINYITLQNLCPQPAVTTPLIPLLQPDNPTPSFTSATKPAMAAGLHQILSISSLPQVVINNPLVPAATTMLSQDSEASSGGAILATSSGLIGTRATSSTQTTWTTLQLAGNTVQPVSQALATDGSRISCNSQQISLSSVGTEPLKHHSNQSSISMQLQSQEPTHIPVPSASPMSSLLPRPAIVSKAVVVHQPSVDAQLGLSQSSVRTQPALLLKTQSKSTLSQPSIKLRSPAQPAIATQAHSKPTVVSQAQSAIVPQLHLSVVPKAQPIIRPPSQPALVPKPQAATLPALQNMQLLQVNSDETPASVTSSPQNNAHVVILQQGSACPATQVIREDANKQTPCQHIVIIQTPALPPATHSHPTACVSTTTQTLPSQITSISSTNTQTTGTKQLLHILPRPLTQPQTQAPQTITVNGQVYVLQPSPDKGNSTSGQTITPFIQPACEEAPSNITMNCLGALTSLSQSIPKVSSQGNMYTVTSAPYTAVHPHPTCGSEVSTSNQTRTSVSLPLTAARSSVKIVQKNAAVTSKNKSKQLSLRKARLPKRKESKTRRSVSRTTRSKPLVVNDAGSKQTNSFCNEDLSKGNETRVETASHQVNAGSITSDFAIVSVDSTSQKSVDTSAILPLSKGSILKRVVHSGDISNEKPKSVDVTLDSTVTVGSPVPSTQGSIVSTNSESLNKKTGAPVVGPQLDCLTACSSSPVIVEAIATLSNSTSVPVNSSDCATFCNETVSQTSISSNIICVNNEDKSQSALILNDCSTLQSTASSTQINSKGKSVHSAPFQPSLSGTALVPSRDFDSNVDSSEVGSAASAIPNQSIIQDNLCRTEELRDSTPIQKLFDVHSTPVSKLSLPVRSAQFHESSDPFKSMNLPNSRNTSMLNLCHGNCLDTKLSVSGVNMPPSKDGQPDCVAEKNVTENDGFGQKDTTPPQRICTMQSDSFETPLGTNRQTESPLNGASGGRGFSVASLLPPGQNINASSNNFGAFTFTSEQAEILAMAARAIFEQDSPGKKTAECSIDKTINNADWDLPKMQSTLSSKDDVTDQQVKLMKTAQTMSKSSSQVSGRVPPVEPLVNSTSGSRLSQNSSYPHSQPVTVTSLNVNNLIRASSNQPYPQSPSLVQRVPASSSGGVDVMASQSSSQAPPNCSGTAHVNEYTPLKNVLMQSHVSVGMVERHQKDMSKRSAQDDLLLPSKRSKQCAPGTLGRVDIKAADHGQMMASQMPSSTSVVMTRNHSDSVGALFSSNNFMSTVNRAPEGHCSTQMPTHEQASMAHLQQGHTHHTNTQSAQSLTGNSYLKHQQQEQRHLYQLQHHLSQTEPQIHSIHQRNLLQEQHVHKKRGVVRGAQTGPNAGLQKQQHQQQPPPHQHQQQQQQHQQHHQQQQSQQQKAQQIQPQQSHQQQQQQQMQQNSHSRHQHLQQQIQQQQHFGGRQDKNCEAQQAGPRSHQNSHLGQSERQPGQDHGAMQRLMVSRSMEQQLTSQASNSVPRPSELACTSSRQDRHRLSSYSAEALIAKTSAAGEQRMHLQTPRNNGHEQPDLRGYVDSSRGKAGIPHSQSRLPPEHVNAADSQRLHECGPFKTLLSGHQLGNFDIQVSRSGDMSSKSGTQIPRGPQSQAGFRMATGATVEGRPRGTYSGPHHLSQSVHIGPGLAREQDGCHQSFMQSLLAPNLPDQNGHQRAGQRCTPTTIEYNCIPGTSTGELNTKSSSPNLHHAQKGPALRLGDSNKGHISHVSGILHAPPARAGPPLPPTPHSSSESGRAAGSTRSLSTVSQRPHPIAPDQQSTKIRQGDRPRSSNLRPGNPFETESSLTLPSSGVLLGRSQPGSEARRSIVRFMADGAQVGSDNSLVSDQHLTQNFGFSFIAESGMNPPPPINANTSFIPPVTQTSSSRTPALLPVETQNTLPSFYPSYSPATHPSLPSEIPLQYFSNQMFTSPSTEKGGNAPLNNRFGSILSPPRPVGFAQASFPLLTDITPMPIGNSSGIPPHLPNFNLTSLFPEIATSMPPDGSSMPMSPLLSLANTTASDSNKQSNRPAHNISHILGHDGTSAV